jgi:hypothetical protein
MEHDIKGPARHKAFRKRILFLVLLYTRIGVRSIVRGRGVA